LGDADWIRGSMTSDGYFRSGDLVTIDEEGFLVVEGRTKEVINRGGYKYSPREVENVLLAHEDIQRIAIIAIPDSRLVERACAVVVPRSGASLSLFSITEYLQAHGVAKFKWPEQLQVVDEIPMTASGKVQKFRLTQLLLARSGDTAQNAGLGEEGSKT
jgi:cyclohexanecarboxylate-CoA ligase